MNVQTGNSIANLPTMILEKQMELSDKLLRVNVESKVEAVQKQQLAEGIDLFA